MFAKEKNGNVTLESKNDFEYLGVLVDKNLTWKYHIEAITAKFGKLLHSFHNYGTPYVVIYFNIFTKH